MPKLLHIDSCLGIYSTGRITEGISEVARKSGWDTYIAHGARCIGKTSQHSYQITSKLDEYIHYAQSLLSDSHGLHSTSATKQLIKWIDELKPDVINLHCVHGYHLNYKVLFEYLNFTDIPIVYTFHDCWTFTGHCSHFVSVGCDKWKTNCHDCPLKSDYPKCIGLDRSKRNYNLKKQLFTSNNNLTIVPVSYWLGGLVEQSFFKDKPIKVIYNGVDLNIFKNRDSNLRYKLGLEGKIVLLAAASAWGKAKGLRDYIELSTKLSNRYQVVLVGLTDEELKQMPESILGVKRTNNAIELAEYYSMADVALNLSYQETFGLTTAEAMACGTPSIVYNCTASPELVTPDTGVIVEPGHIERVLKAVQEINIKGKYSYSKACRERAELYFDKDKQFYEYIKLYNELLEHKNN